MSYATRLGHVLSGLRDGTHGSFARVGEGGVPLLSAKNVRDGYLDLGDAESMISLEDAREILRNGFPRQGDVLLTIVGTIGRVAQFNYQEPLPFQRSVAILRPSERMDAKFLTYQLQAKHFQEELNLRTKVAAQPGVYLGDVAACPVYVPSLEKQSQITKFLDRETAEIDAFVADQEELIALLAERRAATIVHLITRGLDPAAPMRPSGIEWLSSNPVPRDWQAMKLGVIAMLRSGESLTSEDIHPIGDYPVYGGGGFRGYTSRFTNSGTHVLIGRQGALCGNVRVATGRFFATEHAIVAYPRLQVDTTWLASMLEVMNLGQYSQSAAQPGISVEVISQKRTIVPPFDVQCEIGARIQLETNAIDVAIADARNAVALSRERRAALISMAVTGKIDMREHERVA